MPPKPQQQPPTQSQVVPVIHAQKSKMELMKMVKRNIQDLHAKPITAAVPPGVQLLMKMIPSMMMVYHSIKMVMYLNKD